MAIRNIRTDNDEILRKKSKRVDTVSDREKVLIKDMIETMYSANGVGLAAPQVGVLKRIAVVDIGEGIHVFVNPEILDAKGICTDVEGCLSLPGKQGKVKRPEYIKVKALNENGEEFTLDAEGYFARAICHELDHLEGILFIDKLIRNEE